MKGVLPLLSLSVLALGLVSCTPQRTVLSEREGGYSFGDRWADQTGDRDELEKTFASGFEIKEGRAVASDDKKSPFSRDAIDAKEYGKATYKQGNKTFEKSTFNSDKKFQINPFKKGDPARETGAVAPFANQNTDLKKEFSTSSFSGSSETFKTNANRNASSPFDFHDGRQARMDTHAERAQAQVTLDQEGRGTDLTVDEVRRLLHGKD